MPHKTPALSLVESLDCLARGLLVAGILAAGIVPPRHCLAHGGGGGHMGGGGGGGGRAGGGGGGGGGAHFGGYDGGGMRSGGFDGGRPGGVDSGMRGDSGMRDGGMRDGGVRDGGVRDGGVRDGGVRDGGVRDGGVRDGGVRDSGVRDGGVRDVGPGHFAGEGSLSRTQLNNLADRGLADRGVGNRGIRPYSMNTLDNRGTMIRNNFYHGGWYGGRGWYGNHFGPWWPGAFGVGVGVGMLAGWGGMGWGSGIGYAPLCSWGGYGQSPVVYNYGSTICYQDDGVYVSGERVASAPEYAQQAATLAAQGGAEVEIAKDDQWRPLGVFALAREEETAPSTFVSLAIDQAGLLRGTYYDAVSDSTTNITGKVDKKTQRAAWTIGDKKTPIYETGLSNLTQQQTTVLVHRDAGADGGTGKVEQMLLVRVPDQDKEAAAKGSGAGKGAATPERPTIPARTSSDVDAERLSVPAPLDGDEK